MGCKWVGSSYGKKFVLTELGGEDPRIRNKFEDSYIHKTQYEERVPETWIKKGYVREVDK